MEQQAPQSIFNIAEQHGEVNVVMGWHAAESSHEQLLAKQSLLSSGGRVPQLYQNVSHVARFLTGIDSRMLRTVRSVYSAIFRYDVQFIWWFTWPTGAGL